MTGAARGEPRRIVHRRADFWPLHRDLAEGLRPGAPVAGLRCRKPRPDAAAVPGACLAVMLVFVPGLCRRRRRERGGGVQDRQVPLDVFVGRAAELGRVAEVVTRVEAGPPWVVAIEGDPGMGK